MKWSWASSPNVKLKLRNQDGVHVWIDIHRQVRKGVVDEELSGACQEVHGLQRHVSGEYDMDLCI